MKTPDRQSNLDFSAEGKYPSRFYFKQRILKAGAMENKRSCDSGIDDSEAQLTQKEEKRVEIPSGKLIEHSITDDKNLLV